MDYDVIEYNLVLIGWVIALLLGTALLVIKVPEIAVHTSYSRGKKTAAFTILLFGAEIFFQWLIRFHMETVNPILSVMVYLFTFWIAALMITVGFCSMMAPMLFTRRQRIISMCMVLFYLFLLIVVYFLPSRRLQSYGVLLCCGLLFLLACVCIYKSIVIYRSAINELRTYYSDVVESMIRWMPGVGFGIMVFLLSAPITCLCPRWVGINQLALGIIMMIYAFVCVINFSFNYNKVAVAITMPPIEQEDEGKENDSSYKKEAMSNSLSESLRDILHEKAQRWIERGGYRTPGITIEHVAHEMGTNRSYLSRYLNEVLHVTFYEWVAQLRIEDAQSLMRTHPSMLIEQIATRVGFSSASTFSSTFKKMVGIAPNLWRNQL